MVVIQQILENQIALLKQCLEFYGNESNWKKTKEKSLVEADAGFLAQETLRNVAKLDQQSKELSDQYEVLMQAQSSPEALLAEVKKITDQIK